eukprot:8583047-Alexandrium_andersonii.AAC.1
MACGWTWALPAHSGGGEPLGAEDLHRGGCAGPGCAEAPPRPREARARSERHSCIGRAGARPVGAWGRG